MKSIIVDSLMTVEDAIRQNPENYCPNYILNDLVLYDVEYYSFDDVVHRGQIVSHISLVSDIKGAFNLLLKEKFPIQSVIPISDHKYMWDDSLSTNVNNSSAFNYRNVRNTLTLSHHSFGRAIDINTFLNPYCPGDKIFPANAIYDKNAPGTIVATSSLVSYFKNLGWTWGGDWVEDPDYQHFEKLT